MRNSVRDTYLYSLIVLFISVLFLLDPETVTSSVSASLSLCAARVVPAVFPFSVISSFFISIGGVDLIDHAFERINYRLFGIARGASAFLCGLIFGFPLGALTASGLLRRGAIDAKECERLLCYGCCASPTFPVFAVGKGMFGSLSLGIAIWTAQALSAVIIGVSLRSFGKKLPASKNVYKAKTQPVRLDTALTSAVTEASRVMLNVCGAVTFFSLLSAVFVRYLASLCSSVYVRLSASVIFEFTSGCAASASALSEGLIGRDAAAAFAGFAVGFSGLSVLCQTASLFPDGKVRLCPFITSRLVTGVMTALAAFATVRFFPESINVSLFPGFTEASAASYIPSASIFTVALAMLWGEKISTCKKSK